MALRLIRTVHTTPFLGKEPLMASEPLPGLDPNNRVIFYFMVTRARGCF
jgi:hypothetical protein